MISVREAHACIDAQTHPLREERVPLEQAYGRVLRESIAPKEDLPPFDRSAMDGYALGADDPADEFEVVAEVRAGAAADTPPLSGEAVRIFTGAPLPGDGLKVVPQEHVERNGNRIRLLKKDAASYVRQRGEDARAGQVLLEPGCVLNAAALSLLASLGAVRPLVGGEPSVLHLTTGDEIVPPEEQPARGQIRNSNAALIAGLCREAGLPAPRQLHAPDDLPALLQKLDAADARRHDVVLISGGAGGGDYDFTPALFRHLGAAVHFREVNVRPGKPLIFGTSEKQIVFGLPGNALSHFVCFHLFVARALARLTGRVPRATTQAFLIETMPGTQNARETWWPARISEEKGRVQCRAVPWISSGDITRLPQASALLRVPASTPELAAGSMVEILPTGT